MSRKEKEAKPASVPHRGCPGRLGCGLRMHSLVCPQAERGSGAAGLGGRGNAWLLASCLFLVQEPFAACKPDQPCSEPGAPSGELSILRSSTPASSPPRDPACSRQPGSHPRPAPCHPPRLLPPPPSRTRGLGGRGPAAGIACPSGCGPGVGFAEIMPEE